jgi:hypothetical protein
MFHEPSKFNTRLAGATRYASSGGPNADSSSSGANIPTARDGERSINCQSANPRSTQHTSRPTKHGSNRTWLITINPQVGKTLQPIEYFVHFLDP